MGQGGVRQLAGAADPGRRPQSGILVSPDGKTVFFNQDHGGDEEYDIYAVPSTGGPVTNLTATPAIREEGVLVSSDGEHIALTDESKTKGQTDIAVLDLATRTVRSLTHQPDFQWNWRQTRSGSGALEPPR